MRTDSKSSGVYEMVCTTTAYRYIGSTERFDTRCAQHKSRLRRNEHHSRRLQTAWNLYGEEAFEFRVIEECTVEVLFKVEQRYFDVEDILFLFNTTIRAGGPGKHTEETKKKIGLTSLGRRHTNETKSLMSSLHIGKKMSPRARQKMSKAKIGIPLPAATTAKAVETNTGKERSDETKSRISKGNTGKVRSAEARKKIGAAGKGRIPWNKGKTTTPETKAKQSKAKLGTVRSAETRAKMSASHQLRAALRREQKALLEQAAK
jgi:group I intron endonuclease